MTAEQLDAAARMAGYIGVSVVELVPEAFGMTADDVRRLQVDNESRPE